jgi:RNA polymerase sigma-70 factor (ECF subfamily)
MKEQQRMQQAIAKNPAGTAYRLSSQGDELEETTLRPASPEAMFKAHYTRLVRALAVVGGDREAAADAVQEAFIQACLRWDRISRYDDPVAWVRRVALNRLSNQRRSLVRRLRALARSGEPEPTPEPSLDGLDLADALRRLPDQQRTAVALHYIEGLKVREVAQAMNVTDGTVNRHLHRARETLRPVLEERP